MKQVIAIDTNTGGEPQAQDVRDRVSHDQETDDVTGHLWMLYAAGFAFGFAMGAGAAGAGYLAYEGSKEKVTYTKYN